MRISDWSSDVCSSDLTTPKPTAVSGRRGGGRVGTGSTDSSRSNARWRTAPCANPRCGIERWLHANGRRRTCATGSNTEDQPMAENKLVEARTVGIVGARGHTGAELIRLIAGHPRFELVFVSSRELAGQPVSAPVAEYEGSLRSAHVDRKGVGT